MNVIEFYPIETEQEALNGFLSNMFSKHDSKDTKRAANNEVDDIKAENGFNDLMYFKPEQAARSLNKMLEQFAYKEALNKKNASNRKSSKSKKAFDDAAKVYSDATGEVTSQFRQYALGMDGELQKLGTSKKKIDGFEFQAPFYKLLLPQKAQGTKPSDSITKDDLLSIFQTQKGNAQNTGATPIPVKSNTALYVGLGVGVLALTGVGFYILKTKK